jgi:indoleamine 2,3-dioxygenase
MIAMAHSPTGDATPIHPQRGFLPAADPLTILPAAFARWEGIARHLPKLLAAGRVRSELQSLPILPTSSLNAPDALERAMMLLSYFGHAYVWGDSPPADRIPAGIAVPWHAVAQQLGRPPVLSYASYALHNWRRLDPLGPIALGNIILLQNFLAGQDEEWFILVHVEIEAHAAAALAALSPAQSAAAQGRATDLESHLRTIAAALGEMNRTLSRMPERCDPYIYYNRVRPYLYGWKDQPALPDGLIYEGVADYAGQPQKFRGETGAQSSIIPALDAALGIAHRSDPLREYLSEMRDYMPPAHRRFVESIEAKPSVRDYVLAHPQPSLSEAYNLCVSLIERFRQTHLEYAASYIHRQSQRSDANPNAVGTGGTPFMPYLKKHRDESTQSLIT